MTNLTTNPTLNGRLSSFVAQTHEQLITALENEYLANSTKIAKISLALAALGQDENTSDAAIRLLEIQQDQLGDVSRTLLSRIELAWSEAAA